MIDLKKMSANQRLMFITHPTKQYTILEEIQFLLDGGCAWIQLRMKDGLTPDIAKQAVKMCRSHYMKTIVCVDDNVEIALSSNASAVHLGKNDTPVAEACRMATENSKDSFIIGATANTFEDIQQAVTDGASYIGLGPFRYTKTKQKLSPVLGLKGYQNILQKCKETGIEIPIFAIGGIELEDIKELMTTGISGIAVSGAILRSDNPVAQTRLFIEEINNNIIQ